MDWATAHSPLRSENSVLVYRVPWSERSMTRLGRRAWQAYYCARATSSAGIASSGAQPTTVRLQTSVAVAMYGAPARVGTGVMSGTHS
jgi:hypothetical protein